MPYVAMAEVRWCDSQTRKIHSVHAGDEVCEPVPNNVIARGLVAHLDHVPGRRWDEIVGVGAVSRDQPEIAAPSAEGGLPATLEASAVAPEPVVVPSDVSESVLTPPRPQRPAKRKRGRPRKNR